MLRKFVGACLASFALAHETEVFPTDAHVAEANGWNSVQVTVDGKQKTLYMAINSNKSGGSNIVIPFGGRGYLSESASLDPNHFFKPNLLGGSVEYDVDLSTRNCGCIAALYLVGMPGKNSGGQLWNTDGYYYCDGNQVGGNYCPEFDIMEANQWSW